MKFKFLLYSFLTVVCVLFSFLSKAQLPYFESFKNATATGIVFGGAPDAFLTASSNANLDPIGDGYLRLTNNKNDQKGFIYSTNNLTSNQGLKMQFEYYIYGGSGADGISFFLFDATANPFVIGGFGGSLGYSQFTLTSPTSPGVSKGYIGIGIDEYGNFSNPIEGRQGGISGPISPGLRPKSVTIRGKGDGNSTTDKNNYAFLTTAQTKDFGFSLVNDANNRFPDSSSIGYRKAYIDLKPNPAGGYNVSVKITVGGSPTITYKVIDNYYYPENAPTNLRYGIASSTGNATNFHEIRNVFIDIYDRGYPTALDDQIVACSGVVSVINVTDNDSSPSLNGFIQIGSIDLNPDVPGIQKAFVVTNKGTFIANSNGTVTYTPFNASVSGTVKARYTVIDNYGQLSNIANITINEPITANPASAGINQLKSISTATTSINLLGNTISNAVGKWSQVSGPFGTTIVNPNLANSAVNNMSLGTYIFRWTLTLTGQCVSSSDVQVIVNAIPVAVNDNIIGVFNTTIEINIIANDTDRDGNNTIDKKSVSIKSNPLKGIIKVDAITGIVTYTPNLGFIGTDKFSYTIKDITGSESNIATVEIIIPFPPKIGLSKALVNTDKLLDDTFNLKFLFTITNFSSVTLEQLSLKDDLAFTFAGASFTILSLRAVSPSNFTINNAYDGTISTDLLLGNNQLLTQKTALIELVVNVNLTGSIVDFENTSFVEALTITDGIKVSDQSTDGLKPDPIIPSDVSPLIPTPIKLSKCKIIIPPIFSPNGDGINDFFVIVNTCDNPVILDVFNRWGNLVYKSDNYANNWNGVCNEGVFLGQDLPPGTYYYTVSCNFKNYVGFITLNR